MNADEKFFYEHAGYSYDPKKQTAEQGHVECAKALAKAEQHAKRSRIRFDWELDDTTSREFSDEKPFYRLWSCVAWKAGNVIGSLGGIDFGRDKKPFGDPYKRVIEAELSLEDYHETLNEHDANCRDIQTV